MIWVWISVLLALIALWQLCVARAWRREATRPATPTRKPTARRNKRR